MTSSTLVELADRAFERGLNKLRQFEQANGGTAWREAAFQWFSIADSLRARAQHQSENTNDRA